MKSLCNYVMCLILSLIILIGVSIEALQFSIPKIHRLGEPFWQEIDSWTDCSSSCGPGVQTKLFQCVRQSNLHGGVQYFSNTTCSQVPQPSPQTSRDCNWGSCQTGYIWRPDEFSDCSQSCGNQGKRFREVKCYYNHTEHGLILTSTNNCDRMLRPDVKERCNIVNCLPEMVPEKWGPCLPPASKCSRGIQRRKVSCKVVLKNGQYAESKISFCMKTMRLLGSRFTKASSWQSCNHPSSNTPECLKLAAAKPEISVSNLTVVQMRQAKRVILQIGDKAFVIPLTKVVVKCPVMYYRNEDVVWMNPKNETYRYVGKSSKQNRVRVDKKGRLKIKKFQNVDQGVWHCIADDTKAIISLKLQSPSSGFYDWARRKSLRNEEMPNEETANSNVMKKTNIVQWVSGPWTPCSRTCGGDGIQTRQVRCERIDTRFYHILEDSECKNKLLTQPKSKRSCATPQQCPAWNLSKLDNNTCTGECVGLNQGLYQASLLCVHQDNSIDYKFCDATIKPNITCFNKNCQVAWKISKWSKCSKSCGDSPGIKARHLTCVWTTNEKPAGRECYRLKIPIPHVVRSCNPPQCNLKCVDISPYCGRSPTLCKYAVYRHQCCRFCSQSNE